MAKAKKTQPTEGEPKKKRGRHVTYGVLDNADTLIVAGLATLEAARVWIDENAVQNDPESTFIPITLWPEEARTAPRKAMRRKVKTTE